jgi:hypothetical protein
MAFFLYGFELRKGVDYLLLCFCVAGNTQLRL